MATRFAALIATALTVACTPILPFHLGETSEVLRAQEQQLSASGGGGGTAASANSRGTNPGGTCCGIFGADLRGRLGLGDGQEAGVEGAVLFDDHAVQWVSGKGEWKVGLTEGLAFVAGAGAGWAPNMPVILGLDAALVASTSNARPYVLYGGLRLSASTLAGTDLRADGGSTGSVIIPVGVAYAVGPRLRLFAEGGAIGAVNLGYTYVGEHQHVETYLLNFYGAVGLAYTFGGSGPVSTSR